MELENPLLANLESQKWHLFTESQTIERLDTNETTGLTSSEAQRRLAQFGENELAVTDRRTGVKIFVSQLKSSLVVLLLVAMLISLLLGEISDAIAVFAIVVLNTLLGFYQDYQAEKSLAALRKFSIPDVIVRRDGVAKTLPASALVPGDVVMLRAGFFVPADGRLLQSSELAIDESALTGESLPVQKTVEKLKEADLPIGDRTNLVFSGTLVTGGRAVAAVTATGMQTAIGQIAGSLQLVEAEPTPLQIRLHQLSRNLAVFAIVIVALVFVAGLLAGQDSRLMLLTAISLAVAVVPEGLPAVATVALAIGAKRMFKHNALIRQLPAVETLGSVTVICSDKTGTLTQNKMTATILDIADDRCDIRDPQKDCAQSTSRQLLLMGASLCNDSRLQRSEVDLGMTGTKAKLSEPVAVGQPTEKALVEVAARFGLNQIDLESLLPRIAEAGFDSDRKRMTTVHSVSAQVKKMSDASIPAVLKKYDKIAFAKGAVESILEVARFVWVVDQVVPLTSDWLSRIEKSRNEMASQGIRVLAVGFRAVETDDPAIQLERDMIFVGMIGLNDPPRPEAQAAVARCRQAGIRPIMITGDHSLTALSIAQELGITSGNSVVSGQQLATMSAESLRQCVRDVSVFARVAPSDKLNIVTALQDNNEVVAMTGDGVNDAPALKQANVGVAMGQTGTDVSKQAANIVLIDDNFATIVAAVEQGRIVYDNICKFVKYTMSSNVGEVLVMTIGVILGMPLPLLPLQILWINLVTDGLPGLALAIEPAEKNTMQRPPISLHDPILNRRMMWDLLWIGLLIGVASLVTATILSPAESSVDHWRTLVFTVLTFSQMGNVLACRTEGPLFGHGRTDRNRWLWAAIATTGLLQLAVIYLPPLQSVFDTDRLTFAELGICVVVSGVVFGLIELRKLIRTATFSISRLGASSGFS